jgi:hypothetical protein
MQLNIAKEVAAMRRMTMKDLRERYAEAFGETTNANNRVWLIRRIAWRLQARAEGGLTDRARRRAEDLADEADLRLSPPPERAAAAPKRTVTAVLPLRGDDRLPPSGSVITRAYKGETLQVKVLDGGAFEFEGATFKSLSAVARKITGQHLNGFHFFKLGKEAV